MMFDLGVCVWEDLLVFFSAKMYIPVRLFDLLKLWNSIEINPETKCENKEKLNFQNNVIPIRIVNYFERCYSRIVFRICC